eukprot:449658_1
MAAKSSVRWTIYTIGTYDIEPNILIKALQNFNIRTVIDVRVSPNNNKYPQYKLINLKTLCLKNDIKYFWKGQQFGGIHQRDKLIKKLNDNTSDNASFFLRATFNSIEHPSVILCQEIKIQNCIRKHICDALIAYNLANIKHIWIDKNNKNAIISEDYKIDENTKINVFSNEIKTDNDEKTTNLPNDKIVINNNIKFETKLPKEMSKKDMNGFKSALCLIPPSNIWPTIQNIRKKYDCAYYRWQPHLNILYPFIDEKYFESQILHIEKALSNIKPFEIVFKRFNYFDKSGSKKDSDPNCHLFLQPSPADTIGELQKIYNSLTKLYPFCALKKHNQGFMGHLTCAQFPRSKCIENVTVMNGEWKPISFKCEYVYLIARIGDNNPFQIRYKIKLGAGTDT